MRWDQAMFWGCYGLTVLLTAYTVLNMHNLEWLAGTGWFVLFGWISLNACLWILIGANINLRRIMR